MAYKNNSGGHSHTKTEWCCVLLRSIVATLDRTLMPSFRTNYKISLPVAASVALLFATTWGCIKEPDFSDTPEISFKSLSKTTLAAGSGVGQSVRDSLVISIYFKDGDGDLGVNPNDSINTPRNIRNVKNYEVKVLRKNKGVFTEAVLQVPLSGFFPPLRLDKKQGAIEGTLDFSQNFFEDPFTRRRDTLKFEVRIKDRKLNTSNAVLTDEVVIPAPVYKQ